MATSQVTSTCPMRSGSVDLVDPNLYADGDPHEIWRVLRQREPLRWHPVDADLGFWSVTKFADADHVLREHALFTSERGTLLNLLGTDDPAGGRQMAATDPPRHTKMREPLQRALSIKAVDAYRDSIQAVAAGVLEPLGDGVLDFAAAMAELPMAVTGTIMDVPPADWPELTRLTTASVAPHDPEFQLAGSPELTLSTAHRTLFAYFQDLVQQRRGNLRDDLISVLLTMRVDGRAMSVSEIVSNCYSLLLGANVTTPHVASTTVATQAGTGVFDDWAAHPELTATGTEEAIRWASPANHFMRYATRDVTVRGTTIRAGDAVVVWLGSANRDEEAFPDPGTFDLRRRPNKHIAFGIGPHYCVGHSVARVALRVLFAELFGRFTDIELAGPAQRLVSNFVAGIKHLPVTATRRT